MKALAVIALVASVGQAAALTPLPQCYDAAVGDYDVNWSGGGFAFYSGQYGDDPVWILDDCKGQNRLLMTPAKPKPGQDEWAANDAVYDAVMQALESRQSYSMRQIAGVARGTGAKATLGKATYVSCACELYGDE